MALLGSAAIAMWWDMVPAHRTEFEDWHSHEHFPERLSIPGFLRGSRWSSTQSDSFFVMYELDAYETLTSAGYVERLNNPTPWSTKMMPHHSNMVRSQCVAVDSYGAGIAGSLLTARLSPRPDEAEAVRGELQRVLSKTASLPGLTSGHLLQTRTPSAALTTEQKIRGGDAVADWIVLVSGYDARAVESFSASELQLTSMDMSGAERGFYRLGYTMTRGDL